MNNLNHSSCLRPTLPYTYKLWGMDPQWFGRKKKVVAVQSLPRAATLGSNKATGWGLFTGPIL